MTIVRATPADVSVLTTIALAAKRHWGYPEKWLEHWREALTIRPEFLASHEAYVAVREGRSAGFNGFSHQANRLELLHLWVLPELMGRGIGRALFQQAVTRAQGLGCREMVIESDPHAEGFYRRMGACRVKSNFYELDGEWRELPVLKLEIN